METSISAYTMVVRQGHMPATLPDVNYSSAKKAANLLRALSHNIRRDIIKLLQENQWMQVTEIYTTMRLQQAVVSQHLAVLRKAGIVQVRYTPDDCRIIYYSLNRGRLAEIAVSSAGFTG